MTFAVSLRRSRWWLYTKAYILGAMVSLFTATPVSSRIPSAPAQIQQQLTRLQVLRENVQREETRFREALSRAGIPTSPTGPSEQSQQQQQQQDGNDVDLEQGFGRHLSAPTSPIAGKPWAIERALESLGERAQAEAKQREQQQVLQGHDLVQSPASTSDLASDGVGPRGHHALRRSSTAPPAAEMDQSADAFKGRLGHGSVDKQAPIVASISRTKSALRRWTRRFQDLRNIRRLMSRDDAARNLYPEVDWDAYVRKGNELSQLELKFLEARIRKISSPVPASTAAQRSAQDDAIRIRNPLQSKRDGATVAQPLPLTPTGPGSQELSPLHRFLGLPASEKIHPDDVPIVSLGGSGGGYRAKFGFAAFIAALEAGQAWQIVSYVAGVSGSCWTIAELYTHARLSPLILLDHYKRVAAELAHPLSLKALNIVANTRHGVYFLLAPLLRKAQSGVVGLGVMDLYATMTTCYQFLPRPPRAAPQATLKSSAAAAESQNSLISNEEATREGSDSSTLGTKTINEQRPQQQVVATALSRTTFQWSKVLGRAHLIPAGDLPKGAVTSKTPLSPPAEAGGAHPLPLLTAVRVSYADPNPTFLTRKAGVGRRGPIEDDFEREELPQYKAQSTSEDDLAGKDGEADAAPLTAMRRNSLALLERGQASTSHAASPTTTSPTGRLPLHRVFSDAGAPRTRTERLTAREYEIQQERGERPHPYDELVERRLVTEQTGPSTGASGGATQGPLSRPARMLNSLQPGPTRTALARAKAAAQWESMTPQERLERARILLVQSRRQRARAMAEQASSKTGLGVAFQWFEISPIEVGSSDVGAWIPTWSFGRTFLSGRSLSRQPEASLSLLLGQCTSAPAGPLTGYIAALLASLPAGWTLAASLLGWLNALIRAKRWERRWGNPIRAADEPNPFYGLNLSNETAVAPPAEPSLLKSSGDPSGAARTAHPTPKVPRRAMVRGRGASSLYHPHAGPHFQSALRPTPPNTLEIARQLGLTEHESSAQESDSHRQPPRVMARGRGAAHIYDQQALQTGDASPVDLEKQAMPSSSRRAAFQKHSYVAPASLRHHQVYDPYSLSQASTLAGSVVRPFSTQQPSFKADEATSPSSLANGLWTWEASGRIKLMDSGLSNNLPSHVLMHPGRNVDVIIAFDASSDVQKGAAVQRIHEFGRDRGLRFRLRSEAVDADAQGSRGTGSGASNGSVASSQRPSSGSVELHQDRVREDRHSSSSQSMPATKAHSEGNRTAVSNRPAGSCQQGNNHNDEGPKDELYEAEQIRRKFQDKYAQIIDGWRVRPAYDPNSAADGAGLVHDTDGDWVDVEEEDAMFAREPDVRMVYCPLLPSAKVPGFDPSTSAFSTSYNLVWTPDQVKTLIQCTKHNAEDYAIDVIRQVVREVYEQKKRRRLAEEAGLSVP